ncbi:SET domain-containing protein [Streptomyces phaeochromogenes]|uniref:SET domain-containing protein n=1 Tax=Streptomyces TaxID=1883 RepID=UPI002256FC0C|nr:SET domain-containing methyltransferase [Streptomyces phaeochromogenes]MCX5604853.1 SET domain-containing protein [Streptomyces phaeochromogenes]
MTGSRAELILERAGIVNDGYELQRTDAKGEGVFATRSFQVGKTVMVGVIDRDLDHNHSHASQVGEKQFVLHGGLIPKVNHSCEPNCGIRLNASGAHDLIARRPITAGQEITFDYAMRNYSVDHFAAHCQCGSPRCRDRITGWKDLPAERKADYHGFVAPYLTDIDNQPATEQAGQVAPIERRTPPKVR